VFDHDDTLDRLDRAARPSAHVEPLDDWLTVEPTSDEVETRGGLIIPSSAEVPVRSGVEPVLIVRRRDIVARLGDS